MQGDNCRQGGANLRVGTLPGPSTRSTPPLAPERVLVRNSTRRTSSSGPPTRPPSRPKPRTTRSSSSSTSSPPATTRTAATSPASWAGSTSRTPTRPAVLAFFSFRHVMEPDGARAQRRARRAHARDPRHLRRHRDHHVREQQPQGAADLPRRTVPRNPRLLGRTRASCPRSTRSSSAVGPWSATSSRATMPRR